MKKDLSYIQIIGQKGEPSWTFGFKPSGPRVKVKRPSRFDHGEAKKRL